DSGIYRPAQLHFPSVHPRRSGVRHQTHPRSRGSVVGELASLLPLVVIVLLFWFLIIRPASRRQKDQAKLQSAVATGDRVMLTSGIFGTVIAEADDRLTVEVADGVAIEVVRGAIGSVVPREEPGTADDDAAPDQTSFSEDS